jgi:hypothetical protein
MGGVPRGQKLADQCTGLYSCAINAVNLTKDRAGNAGKKGYHGPYEGPAQLEIMQGDMVFVPRSDSTDDEVFNDLSGFSVFNGTKIHQTIHDYHKRYKFVGFARDGFQYTAQALAPIGIDTIIKGITNFTNSSGYDIDAGEPLTWVPSSVLQTTMDKLPHKRQKITYATPVVKGAVVPLRKYQPELPNAKIESGKGKAFIEAITAFDNKTNADQLQLAMKKVADILYDDESILLTAPIGWSPAVVRNGCIGQIVLM